MSRGTAGVEEVRNGPDLGYDIDNLVGDDGQFEIKFVDFSQRRKIGFRGQYEFENKHLMIAS